MSTPRVQRDVATIYDEYCIGIRRYYFQTYSDATPAWISCGRPSKVTRHRNQHQSTKRKETLLHIWVMQAPTWNNNSDLSEMYRKGLGLLGAPPPALRSSLLAAAPLGLALRRLPLGCGLPARSTTSLGCHGDKVCFECSAGETHRMQQYAISRKSNNSKTPLHTCAPGLHQINNSATLLPT